MLNYFKIKNHPKFWIEYLNSFKQNNSSIISENRFVVFDTETTGLNIVTDKILSIGAIAIDKNRIDISDSFEVYLKQHEFNAKTVEIHGLLKEGNQIKTEEKEAIKQFLNYLKNSVIVAHHAAFDIAMINAVLKKLNLGKLKNKFIDTGNLYKQLLNNHQNKNKHFSLDDLSKQFNISQSDRHTASGDAFITALVFLKIISKLKSNRNLKLHDILTNSDRNGLL